MRFITTISAMLALSTTAIAVPTPNQQLDVGIAQRTEIVAREAAPNPSWMSALAKAFRNRRKGKGRKESEPIDPPPVWDPSPPGSPRLPGQRRIGKE
ncbi:hypothetical protein Slin15195_G099920 [Septoria linicola]|uniref:Uncharacterized protein n=1 Tax=Septoria linicola TaxID=215465 RepID=A0A9Q9EPM2_9PEZI|nr:hypothetical protein Slin14017_G062950 [Septoria linicola]USW56673.1 hypothetical protein Slin15195_G099920 [Septoria linicola]